MAETWPRGVTMQALVEYLVKALVDDPDAVQVVSVQHGHTIVYTVSVAEADLGRIIGRQGRTAEALRTVVKTAGKNNRQATTVEILS